MKKAVAGREPETQRYRKPLRHSRLILSITLLAFFLLPFTFGPALADEGLLETGVASKTRSHAPPNGEIKIVSYNIRWRGGDDLRELIRLLRDDREIGQAAIIGLQEVDRNKKRTGNVNTVRLMAEELGYHYAWAAPPSLDDEEENTGVAILSAYPLSDAQRIVLPHPGPGGRRRAAVGVTARIGETSLRVYSVHAETRTSNERRLEQFKAVLDDLSRYTKVERAVVLGDFNTITGKDVRATSELFKGARFQTPFSDDTATWRTFVLKLKLDWLWLRNLSVTGYGIDKQVELSDHWPLWVKVNLNTDGARGEMDIRGKITHVRREKTGGQLIGTLLVEGTKEADTKYDKASVKVTNETQIFILKDKKREAASFDKLEVGDRVEARFKGPVMKSYPVKATASEIVILK
jgi:endonuclease/exonuclease/phosphatase family metal-dependent hydrolase